MTDPSPIVRTPSLGGTLREQRDRLQQTEAPFPGQWVYVLNDAGTVAPALDPPDRVPGDPLARTFKNGWGNVLGAQPVSFRIHPATRVVLRGAIQGGTIPSIVVTLPEGFRPVNSYAIVFPSTDGNNLYSGRVDPNGDVWILKLF